MEHPEMAMCDKCEIQTHEERQKWCNQDTFSKHWYANWLYQEDIGIPQVNL